MTDFQFIRDCKKASELNRSLYSMGVIAVDTFDGNIHMTEKDFLATFPTYTRTAHDSKFPFKCSTVVDNIKFFCLAKEEKEVA